MEIHDGAVAAAGFVALAALSKPVSFLRRAGPCGAKEPIPPVGPEPRGGRVHRLVRSTNFYTRILRNPVCRRSYRSEFDANVSWLLGRWDILSSLRLLRWCIPNI